jgi:hypothetical protein
MGRYDESQIVPVDEHERDDGNNLAWWGKGSIFAQLGDIWQKLLVMTSCPS